MVRMVVHPLKLIAARGGRRRPHEFFDAVRLEARAFAVAFFAAARFRADALVALLLFALAAAARLVLVLFALAAVVRFALLLAVAHFTRVRLPLLRADRARVALVHRTGTGVGRVQPT